VTIHWVPANSSVLDDAAKARVLRRLRPRLTSDGELQLSAQDERSQHRNREIVRERLAALIRESLVVQRRRRATRPTRGSIERRLTEKRVTAEKKRARKPPSDD
jgi:ribosome-associated protein